MKLILPVGSTSVIAHVVILDSTSTTGGRKTALAFGDITAYYVRAGGTLTALTTETIATLGTWASTGDNKLGFKKLDDTNAPGVYELDLPNNILATGANQVVIQLRATGAVPCELEIQLVSATRGLAGTALPAAAADAAGGLPISDAGGLDLDAIKTKTDGLNFTGTDVKATLDGETVQLGNVAHGGAAASFQFGAGGTISNAAGAGLTVTGTTYGGVFTASAGTGMYCYSSGGNGHGLQLSGNGAGDGLYAIGGINDGNGATFAGQVNGNAIALTYAGTGTGILGTITGNLVGTVDTVTTLTNWHASVTDWTDGGRLDLLLDAVLADTAELQANQGNWVTATGFSTLDAAGVRTAVGLASANLDTQLDALPTAAEVVTALKADAQWKAILSRCKGKGVWDDTAKTLKFYDTDNTTLLFTLTYTATGWTVS